MNEYNEKDEVMEFADTAEFMIPLEATQLQEEEDVIEEKKRVSFLVLGLILGLTTGVSVGLAMGHIGLGLSGGILFGFVLGAAIDAIRGRGK